MHVAKQWVAVTDTLVGSDTAHEGDQSEASEVFCAVCQDVLRNGAFSGDPMMPVAFKCNYGHLAHKVRYITPNLSLICN
jgi:hypothetical protein